MTTSPSTISLIEQQRHDAVQELRGDMGVDMKMTVNEDRIYITLLQFTEEVIMRVSDTLAAIGIHDVVFVPKK